MKRLVFVSVLMVLIVGTFATVVAMASEKEAPPVREFDRRGERGVHGGFRRGRRRGHGRVLDGRRQALAPQ